MVPERIFIPEFLSDLWVSYIWPDLKSGFEYKAKTRGRSTVILQGQRKRRKNVQGFLTILPHLLRAEGNK